MTCRRKTGRGATFELTPPRPRVCHEAAGRVDSHIEFRGGSSVFTIPFSISEANMIRLMCVMNRAEGEEISDTGIISMGVRMRQNQGSNVDSRRTTNV